MSASFIPVGCPASQVDEINLSNANARAVLAALGLDPHFEAASPYLLEQVEAECVTFLRIASGTEGDAALPERVDGNMITCARADGYVTARVEQLLSLVRRALENGGTHLLVA